MADAPGFGDLAALTDQEELDNQELRTTASGGKSDANIGLETKLGDMDLGKKSTELEDENQSLKLRIRELELAAKEATDDHDRLVQELSLRDEEIAGWHRKYEYVEGRFMEMREGVDERMEWIQQLVEENEWLRGKRRAPKPEV